MQGLLDRLELRRRKTVRWFFAVIATPAVAVPLALLIGEDGNETRETIAGALAWVSFAAIVAAPWIVIAWRRHMARSLLDAIVAEIPGVRHASGDRIGEVKTAIAGAGMELGGFRGSGLVEDFNTAHVLHVLAGRTASGAFALAEARLFRDGFRVFRGVLGSFALPWSRPALTIVARDRGIVGNLLASAGSGLERIALEDPDFERVFEAYGTDQVLGRVILTTAMLERLRELDAHGHARGFVCAFIDDRLLLAFRGMRWTCASWRMFLPLPRWADGYREWLAGLVRLPAAVETTLRFDRLPASVRPAPPRAVGEISFVDSDGPFGNVLFRLAGEIGPPLVYVASGVLFGGLSLYFAGFGLEHGFGEAAITIWSLLAAGVGYGAFAVGYGGWMLLRFFRGWAAPLRAAGRRSP